ncbi:MAG: ATP-binding cassette domain-containing protein [Proteobacteria bacterium]|jgi:ATP-binding cassette subfamily F protein uup|nr:ATP-binding cassette domain-containing protein [Pseudomonadota bacterium]
MALINVRDVTISFGGAALLEAVSFAVEPGERICLVGRNGEGKTTLMRLIAREIAPDAGTVDYGHGVRSAMLAQDVPRELEGTCGDVVRAAYADDASDAGAIDHEIDTVLGRLGLEARSSCATLSGGQRRRLLLARALAGAPDVLLLDEPTNHLDIDSVVRLEALLERFAGAVVFVTHDRVLIDRLATRILDLDRGVVTSFPGRYAAYLESKGAALEAEQARRERFDKRLAGEEVWLRKGIKARRTRNEGRVRRLLSMREEARRRREGKGAVRMGVAPAGRASRKIAEAIDVSFGYDPDAPLVRGFSGVVWRGDKVGIIGPNGAGKTTLLKLLLGELGPTAGEVRQGEGLAVAYLDQLRAQLDSEKTVVENLAPDGDSIVIGGTPRHVYSYLEDFLFSSDRARTPVWVLSGGERNRLLLAKLFARPANTLVLDEPTNDLDVETLELFEDLLVEYEGTVLLVSHDRAFLNNVVTSTLVFEGGGRLSEYVGGYDDWIRQRPPPAAAEAPRAAQPVRQREKAARPRTLTFKERLELDALPARIEALEAEAGRLRATLADPGFYKTAGVEVAGVNARLAAEEAALAAAYDLWAELESIREASGKR